MIWNLRIDFYLLIIRELWGIFYYLVRELWEIQIINYIDGMMDIKIKQFLDHLMNFDMLLMNFDNFF